MLVFLLACLRFSKLLEILPSVWYNFSNLLKRKQSSRKTSIVCRWLKTLAPESQESQVRSLADVLFFAINSLQYLGKEKGINRCLASLLLN